LIIEKSQDAAEKEHAAFSGFSQGVGRGKTAAKKGARGLPGTQGSPSPAVGFFPLVSYIIEEAVLSLPERCSLPWGRERAFGATSEHTEMLSAGGG
jgi:hypothetical protein